MPVNPVMSQLSADFFLLTLVIYSLALLAFAGDFAYGRHRRAEQAAATAPAATSRSHVSQGSRVPALAGVGGTNGAGAADAAAPAHGNGGTAAPPRMSGLRAAVQAGPWVRAGLLLTTLGVTGNILGVLFRGLAIDRVPLSDMYEFVTALLCVAVLFFLGVMIRYRAWYLGLFVIGSVVVAFGLTETVIYTSAGQVVPALQSYWLTIHVSAMTLATGVFFVAAVLGGVYLAADRHARQVAVGRAAAGRGIMGRLPLPEVIDRLAYRTIVFGFPIWTFGLISGAIWADRAWGSYWSWDPVETFAFITWVVYACFLHARATAGWRGRRAAYIQLLGFACLVFNVLVVQVFITGLHSYAGLS